VESDDDGPAVQRTELKTASRNKEPHTECGEHIPFHSYVLTVAFVMAKESKRGREEKRRERERKHQTSVT